MTIMITNTSNVTLHFSIKLQDGSTAENTHKYKKPAQFKMGEGVLTETFENCLLGLKVGDKKEFQLPPEDAFGMPSPANIKIFSQQQFPTDLLLEEGLIISFEQPNKVEVPGIIRRIEPEGITVDFNHPLCGQTLYFNVEILAIE